MVDSKEGGALGGAVCDLGKVLCPAPRIDNFALDRRPLCLEYSMRATLTKWRFSLLMARLDLSTPQYLIIFIIQRHGGFLDSSFGSFCRALLRLPGRFLRLCFRDFDIIKNRRILYSSLPISARASSTNL